MSVDESDARAEERLAVDQLEKLPIRGAYPGRELLQTCKDGLRR